MGKDLTLMCINCIDVHAYWMSPDPCKGSLQQCSGTMWSLFLSTVAVLYSLTGVQPIFIHPQLKNTDLYVDGDLVLGAILPLQQRVSGQICADEVWPAAMQAAQAFIFAVGDVNADPTVLPNITLGYVLQNDCKQDNVALAKAIKYIPMDPGRIKELNVSSDLQDSLIHPLYDVVGVVGPYSSSMSVFVASLLGLFEVPQISYTATSEELSDKDRFPYFSRVAPPNQYQASAIVDIVSHFKWTYISTLNTDDSFGAAAIRTFHRLMKSRGICHAYSRSIETSATEADFDTIVKMLRSKTARVVVAFLTDDHAKHLMDALNRAGIMGEFIFIGGEAFRIGLSRAPPGSFLNTFVVDVPVGKVPEFEKYFLQQSPWWNATGSIWYGAFQPKHVGCSPEVSQKDEFSCTRYKNYTDIPGFYFNVFPAPVVDSVRTFAHALHHLILDHCPMVNRSKSELKNCVKGPLLLEYIRRTKYTGVNFEIEFDENGDVFGNYAVSLGIRTADGRYLMQPLGTWSRKLNRLDINVSLVQWHTRNAAGDIRAGKEVPESVCSKPCAPGHFYIQGELTCCWECHKCRSNEHLREDAQGCDPCPTYTWPDQKDFTRCETIPPIFLEWHSSIGISLCVLGGAGLIATLVITGLFIHYRSKKVIKASSRELMAAILCGLLLAFSTVFLYVGKRTSILCHASYVGFNVSCTCIFGPLFLKMVRIYRVFKAANRCESAGRAGTPWWQLFFFIIIVVIQVGA